MTVHERPINPLWPPYTANINTRMRDIPDAARELGPDAANILFQTRPIAPHTDRTCAGLLEGDTGPPDCGLWITYTQSPDEKLVRWQNCDSEALPAKRGIIAVGDQTQSAAPSSDITTWPASSVMRTVADPTDLTGLGIEVSKFFEAWDVPDGQFSMCFDSITPLLMYVSVDRAYRFLDVLTSRVEALGGTAHYHIDPDAHGVRTVSRLTSLFDDVVGDTENEGPPRIIS